MQAADGLRDVVFVDDEGEVNFGCALGNHAHIDVTQGGKHAGSNARGAADVLAHQADDRFAALIFHIGDFGQVGGEVGDRFVGIDGEGNTDFRGGNDVDGTAVPVKSIENCFQKSMR